MPPSKSDPRRKPRPVGRGGQRFGQAAAKATGLSDAIASFARSGVGKALLGDSSPKQRKLKGKTYELIPMETGVSGIVGAAARTAGRAAAASGGRSGGKIAASVSADASKAAARRTRQETAAIAKGTKTARSKKGAEALERAEARAASRKSVFDAPKSGVTARAGKETGEMSGRKTLVEEMKTFGKKRSDSLKSEKGKGARTAKQQERVTADLQESMRRGRRLREQGKRDSDDYGTPPDTTFKPRGAAPTAPKAALRETASAARAEKLTKPKNPGRNGTANQQAKYKQEMAAWEKQQAKMASKEKDISEGRRSTETGELRGPSAKSARRQQEKLTKSKAKREDAPAAKKPEVKKPSAKKTDTPKPSADRASGPSQALVRKPAPAPRKADREPIDLVTRPVSNPSKEIARRGDIVRKETSGAGTGGTQKALPAGAPAAAGKKKFGKLKKAMLAGAAIAGVSTGAGDALDRYNASKDDKAKPDTKPTPSKPASPYVRDKFGRKITRAEFNRRAEFRKANNLDSMSPAERAKWRKENKDKWQAEEARRGKDRKRFVKSARKIGDQDLAAEAKRKTRNVKKRKSFDLDAKKSLKG